MIDGSLPEVATAIALKRGGVRFVERRIPPSGEDIVWINMVANGSLKVF